VTRARGGLRVGIVAGEASGDFLAADLLRALRALAPEVCAQGIAGPEMAAAGCRSHYPMARLSVMGLWEAMARYAALVPVRARLARRLLRERPHVFIGVDAPDFNLGLERRLRRAGVPTVHYVSPSVWAWRRYRMRRIARSVDLMLTLFPFEARFYEERGMAVRFVGHPLADIIPNEPLGPPRAGARADLGLGAQGEVVALLPGSRTTEVKYLALPLLRAARWLERRRPGLRFVVPLVSAATRELFRSALARAGAGLDVRLIEGRSRAAMSAADAVIVASGTAALEALLLKRPMVVTYRMATPAYWIMRALFRVPYVSLPNLLAWRALVPELLQSEAEPERLGAALLPYLEEPARRETLLAEFVRIHAELSRDASARAAEAVCELVESRA